MNIGTQILKIRKEKALTQEEFGKIFHVTRQTVSNWENEKRYPDLQILIDIKCRSGSHGVYTSKALCGVALNEHGVCPKCGYRKK